MGQILTKQSSNDKQMSQHSNMCNEVPQMKHRGNAYGAAQRQYRPRDTLGDILRQYYNGPTADGKSQKRD